MSLPELTRVSEPRDDDERGPGLPQVFVGTASDDIRHWLALMRRQWMLMAVVWIMVMVAVVAVVSWWPRKYESTAKFLVRNARQDLVVSPTDQAGGVLRDEVREATLNSEIELLRSRDILAKVVREAGMVSVGANERPELALERAVRILAATLNVGAIRKTNLIQVSYKSRDPEQAASVLRHITDAYLAAHLAVHSSPGTYEFFKTQTEAARIELDRAQTELSALARGNNLIVPEEQRRAALQSANEMENELATLEAQIKEQVSRARSVEMQLSTVDNRIVTQTRKMPNQPSVERLHTLVAELKNKRTQLLTRFNASDRLVVELDEQLANTEAALKEASELRATEEATDVNPSWQALKAEQVTARLTLAGLKSKAERLREQLEQYRARAVDLTEAGPRYEVLSTRVAKARTEFEQYTKRAEEARVAEALDKQKISNVVLAEAPVASYIPASPKVRLLLVIGGMAAVMSAVMAALVTEWLRAAAPQRRGLPSPYPSVPRRVGDVSEA